jgi:hypothetical protein
MQSDGVQQKNHFLNRKNFFNLILQSYTSLFIMHEMSAEVFFGMYIGFFISYFFMFDFF